MKTRPQTLNLVVFVFGLLLTTAGAYLVYPPAGLLVPGLIFLAISIFGGNE